MNIIEIINKKSLKKELTKEEIYFAVEKYMDGEIKDYQFASLLMSIKLNGMTDDEIFYLTKSYIDSGEKIDFGSDFFIADKHSTGGIGDKTSIILAPLLSSLGVSIGKLSGRGLGFTGGTIDKLESIKNFSVNLTKNKFISNVKKNGISLIGQLDNVTPADKKIYSLRDVTATVDSLPLIVASIMSKKLANGADYIILDVKQGKGAFMKNVKEAELLSKKMNAVAKKLGRKSVCVITDMNEPLGNEIGNANEIKEAIDVLQNKGPKDITDLCVYLASKALSYKENISFSEAKRKVNENLENGKAMNKFIEWIKIQGGDTNNLENNTVFKPIKTREIKSSSNGYVEIKDSSAFGMIVVKLGGGRQTKEDKIDHQVGITIVKNHSEKVKEGGIIAMIHYNPKSSKSIEEIEEYFFEKAVKIVKKAPKTKKLIIKTID